MISISGSYTQREFRWKDWKTFQTAKELVWQSDTSTESYLIWGYDGPEVYITQIWIVSIPDSIKNSGYSQAENDEDKTDWETNFLPTTNKKICK